MKSKRLTNEKHTKEKLQSNSQTDSQKLSQEVQNNSRIEDPNNSQQLLQQQEEQNNSQIEDSNSFQQPPQQQQSLLKSIYQLFNMYVVEYDDGSGNTIKMHFNEEEYKRIFASESCHYPY